jgi:metallo-beta-lactamase class B
MKNRPLNIAALALACLAMLAGALAATPAAAATYSDPRWTTPIEPFRISGDLYYVGGADLTAYLIATPKGLIVIDGGVAENAPTVLEHIRKLGFDPRQVKILLNSHAHLDHAGALAGLKRATGAKLVASAADAPVLESGGEKDFFYGGHGPLFPKVHVDRLIGDGGQVNLGGVTLTAHLTPGHTKGCTTWSLPLKVDGQVRQALFICSLSILPGYRLTGDARYPRMGADYAHAVAVLRKLPCDVFLASHGSFYDLLAKRQAMVEHPSAPNPFVDPQGCKALVDEADANLRRQLAARK